MSCGVDHRCGSDPALLWLWHRLAATAPIGPLAWELLWKQPKKWQKDQKKKTQRRENIKVMKIPESLVLVLTEKRVSIQAPFHLVKLY